MYTEVNAKLDEINLALASDVTNREYTKHL